jgi:hypothetical protein
MTSRFLQFLFALVLCVTLVPCAYAKGGHGNGHGGDRDKHADRDHDRDGDHDRDDNKRPAGWDKGKKTGWGDCDVPPGQVKKQGCHPDSHHHVAHHDRDRDHDRDTARNHDRDRRSVRHTSTTTGSTATNTTTKKTTTTATKVPAPRRSGKTVNEDGTWHYGPSQPATTTTSKK